MSQEGTKAHDETSQLEDRVKVIVSTVQPALLEVIRGIVIDRPGGPTEENTQENAFRERELRLKEQEKDLRVQELEYKYNWKEHVKSLAGIVVTLIAALIAGYYGITQVRQTAKDNLELERTKWQQSRHEELTKNASVAISEFARNLSRGLQASSRILDFAINQPWRFGRNQLDQYEAAMQEVLSAGIYSLTQVNTYSLNAYLELSESMGGVSHLRCEISPVAARYLKGTAAGKKSFERLRTRLPTLETRVRRSIEAAANDAYSEIVERITAEREKYGPPSSLKLTIKAEDKPWLYFVPCGD